MDFQTAVKTCFAKYATFQGTAHRPEYWWFVLFLLIGNAIASLIDYVLFGTNVDPISALFSLGTLLPTLAVGSRRLHDIGRSAWWLLLILVPIIGTLVLIWWFTRPAKTVDNPFV